MNLDTNSFLDYFDETTKDCQKFSSFVRGKEFQVDAFNTLKNLKEVVIEKKQNAIKNKNEFEANLFLSLEHMVLALLHELKMIINLKEDFPNEAWDNLINAQSSLRTALQAHPQNINLESYVQKLYGYEKLLFPQQLFFSTGLVAIYSSCSVCGKEYGECEHLLGKAYMGKICCEIVEKSDLKEVSIVDTPANKRCRAYSFDYSGKKVDAMTFREIKENDT
jgi:hypothetical protein